MLTLVQTEQESKLKKLYLSSQRQYSLGIVNYTFK